MDLERLRVIVDEEMRNLDDSVIHGIAQLTVRVESTSLNHIYQ
jgi:hypothetical protein